jgi:hypothetical protein
VRALLYQASQQEKNVAARVAESIKFMNSLDAGSMGGGVLAVMGTMIGEVPPSAAFNANAVDIARLYALAGKSGSAEAWVAFARGAAGGTPQAAAALKAIWPLTVFAGLEPEKDFAGDIDAWLDATLRPAAPDDADARAKNAAAGALVLLMSAAGFPVGDDELAKIADTAIPEKLLMPAAAVMDRLHLAASSGHKGEAILMGLLVSAGAKADPPLLATLETIRALRAVGLRDDAGKLAEEAALGVLSPPEKSY